MLEKLQVESKINLGILVSGLPPEAIGGAELQVQQLAEQLAQRGHQVAVFTRSADVYSSVVKQNGYTVYPRHPLRITGLRMTWDIISGLWHIARCRPRLEVLLCYESIINGVIGVIAQILLGIPTVVSIRGNREYRLQTPTMSPLTRFLTLFVYKKAKCIVVQTPHMLNDLQVQLQLAGKIKLSEMVRTKTKIISNGLHLSTRKRVIGTKVIYVGRLIRDKGVADLIEVIKQLPQAELLIVGDGPDRPRLESLAKGTSTFFVGRVTHTEVTDYYLPQARVLVLPSYLGDGLPNVILEAMALGVPVVATNTAGIPDVVSHGETGFVYEPGDIRQMVTHISRLLIDDELYHQLSQRNLQQAQSFSWDAVIPQIEQLLAECLD